MQLRRVLLVISSLSILLGCNEIVEISEYDEPVFVFADKPLRFFRQAYPPRQPFQLVVEQSGRQFVMIYSDSTTGVVSGGGVALGVPSKLQLGVSVDQDLCFDGEYIQDPSIGATSVFAPSVWGPDRQLDPEVCFNRY